MKLKLPAIETIMFGFGSFALGLLEYELTDMDSAFIASVLAFIVSARVYISNYLGRVSKDDDMGATNLSIHSGVLSILFIAYAGVIIIVSDGWGLTRKQWIQLLLMTLCIYSLYICQGIFMLRQEILGRAQRKAANKPGEPATNQGNPAKPSEKIEIKTPHIGEVQRIGTRYRVTLADGLSYPCDKQGNILETAPSVPTGIMVNKKK